MGTPSEPDLRWKGEVLSRAANKNNGAGENHSRLGGHILNFARLKTSLKRVWHGQTTGNHRMHGLGIGHNYLGGWTPQQKIKKNTRRR